MIDRARRLVTQAVYSDYLPIFALIIAVQGTVLVSQALGALLVSPAHLGVIRTFESVFGVLVLVAGFGAPALAVREMAMHHDPTEQANVLRDLTLLPISGALITVAAAGALMLAGINFVDGPGIALVLGVFLLIAVNLVRLVAAAAQGLQIVRHIYLATIAGSLACAAIQTIGAVSGSAAGWVAGRLVGEAVLLASLVTAAWKHLPKVVWSQPIGPRRLAGTMGRATVLNLALIVRMAADAAPIVLLSLAFKQKMLISIAAAQSLREEIGYFGLATLAMTLAMLPISIVSQREQPVLTRATTSERARLEAALRQRMLFTSIVISLPLLAMAGLFNYLQIPKISPAMLPAAALFAIVPVKAIALARAGILMSRGRYAPILATNIVELGMTILYVLVIDQSATKWTGVAAIAVGSGVSLIGLHIVGRSSQSSTD